MNTQTKSRSKSAAWMAAMLVAIAGAACSRAEEPADPVGAALAEYGRIHETLAADRVDGVTSAAARLAEVATQASAGKSAQESWSRLAAAAAAMNGSAIGELRGQLMELSKAMAEVVNASGSVSVNLFYCPMVEAYWLQKKGDDTLRNPYYGASMLRCGRKVEKVEG